MEMIFLYGQAASGKLTIGRALAARTGYALFHNHLVVDALLAVFPFGSDAFVRLREAFWLDVMETAARSGQSLIFTFAPEPTVSVDFPERAARIVAAAGGHTIFAALSVTEEEQERRLANADRGRFAKLRSVDLLRQLRPDFDLCLAAMPPASVTIDTEAMSPDEAAARIQAISRAAGDGDQ